MITHPLVTTTVERFRPLKPTLKITSARLFLGGKADAKLRRVAGIAADCRIPVGAGGGGGGGGLRAGGGSERTQF